MTHCTLFALGVIVFLASSLSACAQDPHGALADTIPPLDSDSQFRFELAMTFPILLLPAGTFSGSLSWDDATGRRREDIGGLHAGLHASVNISSKVSLGTVFGGVTETFGDLEDECYEGPALTGRFLQARARYRPFSGRSFSGRLFAMAGYGYLWGELTGHQKGVECVASVVDLEGAIASIGAGYDLGSWGFLNVMTLALTHHRLFLVDSPEMPDAGGYFTSGELRVGVRF